MAHLALDGMACLDQRRVYWEDGWGQQGQAEFRIRISSKSTDALGSSGGKTKCKYDITKAVNYNSKYTEVTSGLIIDVTNVIRISPIGSLSSLNLKL